MAHKETDPILLTAICTFALDLFMCEEIKNNENNMRPYYDKMKDMYYLVPYLGFDSYPNLLAMTRRYHSSNKPRQIMDGAHADGQEIEHKGKSDDMG